MPVKTADSKAPLRKVIGDPTISATVLLECGHIVDARSGCYQPKRRRCFTCLPLETRQKVIYDRRKE
jgi:hypothetical protein